MSTSLNQGAVLVPIWAKALGFIGVVMLGVGVYALTNDTSAFGPLFQHEFVAPILIGIGAHLFGIETGILLVRLFSQRKQRPQHGE